MDYNLLKTTLKKAHLNSLIKNLTSLHDEYRLEELQKTMEDLKPNIILNDDETKTEPGQEPGPEPGPEQEIGIFNQSDNYLYKKPWNKLAQIHKILKIKQYVKTQLGLTDKKYENELINELIGYVKNKILSKKKTVNYDFNKEKIISIPNLKFSNNKYILII